MKHMHHAGRTLTHAVAVGRALNMTGERAYLFASILAALPASAKVESLSGDLFLDTDRLPLDAESRHAFESRLANMRGVDLGGGAPVHRPFAEHRQTMPGPAAGSVDSIKANARAALGARARKDGGDYLDRAAKRVAELRASPGSTMTSTTTAGAPAVARPVRPAGSTAADMQAAFGLDPANAAKLAAATNPSAPKAASAGKVSEAEYLSRHASLARLAPGSKEHTAHKAELLEFARSRGII